MPNDCWNVFTVKAENAQIRTILTQEFTNVPRWAFRLFEVGEETINFKIWSRWSPDKDLMDRLFNSYEGIWIKNEWNEEGGLAGVIVGTKDDQEAAAQNEFVSSSAAGTHAALFDGPADLALQRKMENESKKSE